MEQNKQQEQYHSKECAHSLVKGGCDEGHQPDELPEGKRPYKPKLEEDVPKRIFLSRSIVTANFACVMYLLTVSAN